MDLCQLPASVEQVVADLMEGVRGYPAQRPLSPQTFSRNTRMFGVVALRDDRRLVVTGRVRVGAQGQVGTGSSGIHGRPSSASRRTVTMLRPCLAAVDA